MHAGSGVSRSDRSAFEAFALEHRMQYARRGDAAGVITVPARPHFLVEVLLPDAILEWWVTVRSADTHEEVFADWCEHYRVDPRDGTDLREERFVAATTLLVAVRDRELRVRRRRRSLQLEVSSDAGWKDLWEVAGGGRD